MILALILAFGVAHADDHKCQTEILDQAETLLQRARDNGWTQVGGKSLMDLQFQILAQQPKTDCKLANERHYDGRSSGAYFQQDGTEHVHINSRQFHAQYSNLQPPTALHENLGALGYDDRDYQMSTRVDIMAGSKYLPGSVLEKPLTGNVLRKGGSTGVGGGGDGLEIMWKETSVTYYSHRLVRDGVSDADREERLRFAFDVRFYFDKQDPWTRTRLYTYINDDGVTLTGLLVNWNHEMAGDDVDHDEKLLDQAVQANQRALNSSMR